MSNRYYYWGRVEADGSPVVIQRNLFWEHVHVLGNSGSGKSSMRLAPLVEQTIGFGDTSLIFIDLKGDKLENLAACMAAQKELKQRTGQEMPIRVFTLENGKQSHVFNPFLTSGLENLSQTDRVNLITETLSLFYGIDYARGHFSAKNTATVREISAAILSIRTFHELYSTLVGLAADPTTYIGSQHRNEYIGVAETILSIASCSAINVSETNAVDSEVLDSHIDLAKAFQTPSIYYFYLPTVTSPFVAQTIGRLVVKYLLVAAKSQPRKNRVQVVIDEFQRMIADNLEVVLQQARGFDIGLVLANQSLGDLKACGPVLLNAIEGNCAIRQWLSVTAAEDLDHLAKLFGTQKELVQSETASSYGKSVTTTVRDAPRITTTDLHCVSSNPFLSVTKINGERNGYAQYRGAPFVVRNSFHITSDEYDERLKFSWPSDLPGMVQVSELPMPALPIPADKKKRGAIPRDRKDIPNTPIDSRPFDDLFG
jgi:hypothetical protein